MEPLDSILLERRTQAQRRFRSKAMSSGKISSAMRTPLVDQSAMDG
jgi:hypothetical protein